MNQPRQDDDQRTLRPSVSLDPSRRDFLQASVALAGSALLSSCGGQSSAQSDVTDDYFPNIKHLVVVMFENRSFDNLLAFRFG